jgi:hypothetical protein
VNKKGAGRSKILSAEEEISLTLFYLRQMPIFETLGMMFGVSRSTAHTIFHYWLSIFRDLLPSSLLEEWQRAIDEDEWVKELLTSHELLVDSFEQSRERPTDYQEQEKFYSGKAKRHTFKNQIVSLPKGNDIADAVVGERGPEADINLLRKQQKHFSKNQKFKGDKAYQIIKIFRIASERFRLRPRSYSSVMLVVLGLIRLRIGAFSFSF